MSFQIKTNFIGHTSSVNTITRLNSLNLATGSDDFSIKIWNVNDGTLICTLNGHTNKINKIIKKPNLI